MGNVMNMGSTPSENEQSYADGGPIRADLIQRLSSKDLQRYQEGFRRICRTESKSERATISQPLRKTNGTLKPSGVNSTVSASMISNRSMCLSKKVFRAKLLSSFPMIPSSLSDRLFEVLDTDQRNVLTVENILRGVALLRYGTREEHIQLLFTIYDLDETGLLTRENMDRFMNVIYGRFKARNPTTRAFLDRVFQRRASLTIDEFKDIVGETCGDDEEVLLMQWLYLISDKIGREEDADIVSLEKQYNPIVIRQRIADKTQFTVNDITTLEKEFHKWFDTKDGTSSRIPCDQFVNVLAQHEFPKEILECVTGQLSKPVPGMVLFEEFCVFLSKFCRGDVMIRCENLFELYQTKIQEEPESVMTNEVVCELMRVCTRYEIAEDESTRSQRQIISEKLIHEHAGNWNKAQFLAFASISPRVLGLLHQMAFAACILFSIKPESPYLEKRIILWHWEHSTEVFQAGQTWALMETKWWRHWCHFVGMDQKIGTPCGNVALPLLPREARGSTTSMPIPIIEGDIIYTRPGTISNWGLLQRSGSRRLKEKLVIGRDFYLVPHSVYSTLWQWYRGGPDLFRTIIELPNSVLQLELFPPVLRVAKVDPVNGDTCMSGQEVVLSSTSSVESLLQATCDVLLESKSLNRSRLWYFDEHNPQHKYRIRSSRGNADLKRLTQSCVLLLEIRDEKDGSWPLTAADGVALNDGDIDDEADDHVDVVITTPGSNGSRRKRARDSHKQLQRQSSTVSLRRTSEICSRGNLESLASLGTSPNPTTHGKIASTTGVIKPVEEEGLATARTLKRRFSKGAFTGTGLVGLENLGNTCYMSSALQCLSHTRLLVEYFKNEDYLHDINLRNRDGTNGKLAVAFGELLRVLWTSEKKRFAPTELKRVLSRFNPLFSGSDQHDAQELLACLLSALSEDLNRVAIKPYTEQPDSDGRCDSIVADEWWRNHLQREFSVVVALFTGQYKSLLECSVCHYESARFEPFTFLQLSLPESGYRSFVVTVIFNNGRVPLKHSVRVYGDGTIQDIVDDIIELILRLRKRDLLQGDRSPVSFVEDDKDRNPIRVILARISTTHTVDMILDNKLTISKLNERDQLTAYELDPLPEARVKSMSLDAFTGTKPVISRLNRPLLQHDDVESRTENNEHRQENVNGEVNAACADYQGSLITSSGSPLQSQDQMSEIECGSYATTETCDETSTTSLTDQDDKILSTGASVYVKAGKSPFDFVSARVIGFTTTKELVDIAFASGVKRYQIPVDKVFLRKKEDAFLFLVHRRVERSVNEFTESHVTRLFGAPLVLHISLKWTTNYDIYLLVWRRLSRIFNWTTLPSKTYIEEVLKNATIHDTRTDITRIALGNHLALTQFGFCLRMVNSTGVGCSRCEWIDGCLGCVIVPFPNQPIQLAADETLAIDWDIRTLKEEYDSFQASKLDIDESLATNDRSHNSQLNIHRCLEIFTAEEGIQEAYCGRCKVHRPATKTMNLWRLPPILVIQLKRFCFTQSSRRKLHHFVDFPLEGLRLHDFLAKKRMPTRVQESGLTYWLFLGGKFKNNLSENNAKKPISSPSGRRNLLEAPATATEVDREASTYDLYAVVNHVGALGAGHYFAYILSEEGDKWKCFNDHQCKDIDKKEVVSSSAYILFYRRRDMCEVMIEDVFPPIRGAKSRDGTGDGDGISTDQAIVEELVEQTKLATTNNDSTCVIS